MSAHALLRESKMALEVENNSKELGKWMKANGITGADAPKFLKALEKQVGKNAKTIKPKDLEAVKKSVMGG